MSPAPLKLAERAQVSSVVVRLARRAAADSAVWARVAPIGPWLRRTRHRFAAGLRRGSSDEEPILTAQRLDRLGENSRVVAALWTLVTAPVVAWHGSMLRRQAEPFMRLDLPSRIGAIGVVLGTAVLTHVVVSDVLGVSVQVLGWSTRAVLFTVSIIAIRRPNPLAGAWRQRFEQATMSERP